MEREPETESTDQAQTGPGEATGAGVLARCAVGGVLMGLANLVPGISGGTMLLATGVYTRFIDAISDATRLKFRRGPMAVLGTVLLGVVGSIVLLAGLAKGLVLDYPWVMRSLFIGLTLGGAPLLWSRLTRGGPGVRATGWVGLACGLAAMVALAIVQGSGAGAGAGGASGGWTFMLLAGIAGASAMILPGVSGAYLLLVLGQYVPILGSIDRAKEAAFALDVHGVAAEFGTLIPLGVGVVIGVVGVANLLRMLLHRFEHATLGVLLGLLIGAVAGLYPFQAPVRPQPGDVIKGEIMTPESIESLEKDDWRLETFAPAWWQVPASVGLIGVGIGATLAIGRLGSRRSDQDEG